MLVVAGDRLGGGRFFFKPDDAMVGVGLHDAKFFGFVDVDLERGDRQVGVVGFMKIDHLAVVHLIDVIASKDDDVLGAFLFERVDVLINGVGGALVPLFVDALLGRDDVDELAQLAAEQMAPAGVDVAVEAHRFVLREHQHLADAAVDAIGKREVDDAIGAAERDGRLSPIAGERFEPRAFSACEDDCEYVFHRELPWS